MFEQALGWISRFPRIRKVVVKVWRAFLRMQRATLAQAVLVVRRPDDCVLAVTSASGELRLPSIGLNGWEPVGSQVQGWVDQIGGRPLSTKLQGVDATPGREGITFLYSADADGPAPEIGCIWLEEEFAVYALSVGDRRLLLMSKK